MIQEFEFDEENKIFDDDDDDDDDDDHGLERWDSCGEIVMDSVMMMMMIGNRTPRSSCCCCCYIDDCCCSVCMFVPITPNINCQVPSWRCKSLDFIDSTCIDMHTPVFDKASIKPSKC